MKSSGQVQAVRAFERIIVPAQRSVPVPSQAGTAASFHGVRKQSKAKSEQSKAMSFIDRKSRHLISEIDIAIKECDDMIDKIIKDDDELRENYEIVTSIKGVARQNGVCLLVYTNNFKRFDMEPRKIACYYGVAPFGKTSGTSVHSPARTSHFANKLIKALLTQAAQIARIFNPEIKAYY